MEAVLTIAPPLPCDSICAISYLRQRKTPVRLTASIPSNTAWLSSCVRWPTGPMARPEIPALLNAQSIRPKADTVRATIAATSASRVTSPPMAIARPPAALISATVAAASASTRSATATRAPSRAITTAVAWPIPDAPPVTRAILPSRMPDMLHLLRDDWRSLRLIRPDPHQLLAEVRALQKAHERRRRAVEAFGDELLVLDLALAHPARHVAQEVAVTRGEIADDEAADGQALGQHVAHHRRRPFRRYRLGVVVMRDQAAHGNARKRVEQRKHRLEHRAADVLEIDVDAFRAGKLQLR